MDFTTFVIVAAIIGSAAMLWFAINRKLGEKKDDQSLVMLQSQLTEMNKILHSGLGESSQAVQKQFSESAKIIRDITERLTRLDEQNKRVISFTDQLKQLQDILANPKQRGMLGEYSLEVILENFFPHNYERQYQFADGSAVDFIIHVRDKLIPIDSKFSLENYQRILKATSDEERARHEEHFKADLKRRIDETAKYIKPDEGTMEFAFMFIPAEAVYYDLLVNKIGAVKSNTRDLIEYAMGEKKVIVVSPTSFLAYLETVLQGLRAMQIEESAKEIRKRVGDLTKHLATYEEYMRKVGTHLGTTVNMYNRASKEFKKIDKDVTKISGTAIGAKPLTIDGPEAEA